MWTYSARVVRVIDGDTIVADIDLGFNLHYIAHVRLLGINAPEMRTTAGPLAKTRLESLLGTTPFVLTTTLNKEFEKYGRVLGELLVNGVNINQQMITEGFAVKA